MAAKTSATDRKGLTGKAGWGACKYCDTEPPDVVMVSKGKMKRRCCEKAGV